MLGGGVDAMQALIQLEQTARIQGETRRLAAGLEGPAGGIEVGERFVDVQGVRVRVRPPKPA